MLGRHRGARFQNRNRIRAVHFASKEAGAGESGSPGARGLKPNRSSSKKTKPEVKVLNLHISSCGKTAVLSSVCLIQKHGPHAQPRPPPRGPKSSRSPAPTELGPDSLTQGPFALDVHLRPQAAPSPPSPGLGPGIRPGRPVPGIGSPCVSVLGEPSGPFPTLRRLYRPPTARVRCTTLHSIVTPRGGGSSGPGHSCPVPDAPGLASLGSTRPRLAGPLRRSPEAAVHVERGLSRGCPSTRTTRSSFLPGEPWARLCLLAPLAAETVPPRRGGSVPAEQLRGEATRGRQTFENTDPGLERRGPRESGTCLTAGQASRRGV